MSRRFTNFDLLRGLATLAVLIIHVTAPLQVDGDLLGSLLNQASRFAVPIFLILSGWGLDRTDALDTSESYTDYLKTRLGKILPQYLFWTLLYAIVNAWWSGSEFNLRALLIYILTGRASYHLYFIPLITGLYLLYPVLSKLATRPTALTWFTSLFFFQHLTDHWWGYIPYNLAQDYLTYTYCFVFGIWLSQDFKNKLQNWHPYRFRILVITLVLASLAILENYISHGQIIATTRPMITLYSMGLTVTAMLYPFPFEGFLHWLSRHSFLIYLSHVLILNSLEAIGRIYQIQLTSGLYIVITSLVLLACLWLLVQAVDQGQMQVQKNRKHLNNDYS